MYYPEHSHVFLENWKITGKRSVTLHPGEQTTISHSCSGYFDKKKISDLAVGAEPLVYLKGKTSALIMRVVGDIGHDAETSLNCGYTATKLDLVRLKTSTFRFFNASKQLKYDFYSQALGTASRSVAKLNHDMETDVKADDD
ncbi:hypothetical protein [Circoviridae 5 LDMD-2013]|uniref:hypothetical protein n=1 Tax=Circoviridae 5 LDMD-2013 TaxID=1379709 RepID=UPI00038463CC|nr:hypothetical protein [Circoviridae 5 LDMD-2013]AGS36189.1 hypothetical protein [Circoviridae 5 LDMD-2013]